MSTKPKDEDESFESIFSEDEEELFFLEAMSDVRPLLDKDTPRAQGEAHIAEQRWLEAEEASTSQASRTPAPPRKHRIQTHSVEQIGPLAELTYLDSSVPRKIERKLRKGGFSFRVTLDLHGLTWKEAEIELADFVDELSEFSMACGLLIHGKGHGAVLGRSTMKTMVYHYLKTHPNVLAVLSARPKDGGRGAAYVLVR